MTHPPRDIKSVADLVANCHSLIVESQDTTQTSIQRQQAEARLRQRLSEDGITWEMCGDALGGDGSLFCRLAPVYVQDSGVIIDVSPVGSYPIHLSVGERIFVHFEPRDITQVPSSRLSDLSNARFADLKKGSSFAFTGRIDSCRYEFDRPGRPFYFLVDSEFRSALSLSDRVRKLWDGTLPGIEYIR